MFDLSQAENKRLLTDHILFIFLFNLAKFWANLLESKKLVNPVQFYFLVGENQITSEVRPGYRDKIPI